MSYHFFGAQFVGNFGWCAYALHRTCRTGQHDAVRHIGNRLGDDAGDSGFVSAAARVAKNGHDLVWHTDPTDRQRPHRTHGDDATAGLQRDHRV